MGKGLFKNETKSVQTPLKQIKMLQILIYFSAATLCIFLLMFIVNQDIEINKYHLRELKHYFRLPFVDFYKMYWLFLVRENKGAVTKREQYFTHFSWIFLSHAFLLGVYFNPSSIICSEVKYTSPSPTSRHPHSLRLLGPSLSLSQKEINAGNGSEQGLRSIRGVPWF